jgi:ABC-type branched-subunit amino acid transport system permease subunit
MTQLTVRESVQESAVVRLRRWATSASGVTIIITIIGAIWATIDGGSFILVNTIVTGGMWALLSVGLSLVFGVMNIPNFAHGEFFLAGSFTAYFVFTPIRELLRRVHRLSSATWRRLRRSLLPRSSA